ncbi:MAG: hypothetical protein AAFP79_05535 [Pseudomonadota bacterium]
MSENAKLSWQEVGLGSMFLLENLIELQVSKGLLSKVEAETVLSKTVADLAPAGGQIGEAAMKLKDRWEKQGYSL